MNVDFPTALLLAFGLVLVIEGLLYALFPDAMLRMMKMIVTMPAGNLRIAGLVAVSVGVAAVWTIRLLTL